MKLNRMDYCKRDNILENEFIRRDMHEVLSRWGRWAANDEYCSHVDWPRHSLVFKHTKYSSLKPSCSDSDGMIVDACVAQLSKVYTKDHMLIVGLRFIKGAPICAIAEILQTNRTNVAESLRISEAFLEGYLLNKALYLDMDYQVMVP